MNYAYHNRLSSFSQSDYLVFLEKERITVISRPDDASLTIIRVECNDFITQKSYVERSLLGEKWTSIVESVFPSMKRIERIAIDESILAGANLSLSDDGRLLFAWRQESANNRDFDGDSVPLHLYDLKTHQQATVIVPLYAPLPGIRLAVNVKCHFKRFDLTRANGIETEIWATYDMDIRLQETNKSVLFVASELPTGIKYLVNGRKQRVLTKAPERVAAPTNPKPTKPADASELLHTIHAEALELVKKAEVSQEVVQLCEALKELKNSKSRAAWKAITPILAAMVAEQK